MKHPHLPRLGALNPLPVILMLASVSSVAGQQAASESGSTGTAPTKVAAPNTAVVPDDAQDASLSRTPASFATLFRDLGGDFKHLPSSDSLLVGVVGGGLAVAAHPFDSEFNQHLLDDEGFFKAGDRIGNTATLMGASLAAYGIGRLTGRGRMAHVGMDLLRAQIVTETLVQSTKIAVRRPRPDGSSGYAFPSGHSALTFATATVIERHHGIKWALPLYGVATYVAMSRLHDNVHSLSDVVFGAAVGTIVGRTVTRHGRSNFFITPIVAPGGEKGLAFVRSW